MMADGTYGEGRTDASAQHRALVALLTEGGYLSDPRVEAAFRAVPRHLFLPDVPLEVVYADEAIPTKRHEGLVCLATIRVAGRIASWKNVTLAGHAERPYAAALVRACAPPDRHRNRR